MSPRRRPAVTPFRWEDSPLRPHSYHGQSPPQDIEELTTSMPMLINSRNVLVNAKDLILDEIIGKGHFATVYKVKIPSAQAVIAVKESNFINHERSAVREIQNLQRCNSPFLVTCYGILQSEGYVLFCLELMDCSLKQLIKKQISLVSSGQLFSDDLISASAYSITSALHYLKSLNVMHRDVKPSNVLIDRMGKIKLCDFGISVVLKNSVATSKVGSQIYLSPERLNCQNMYSWKSDVWALGLTLMELVIGKFPYSFSSEYDLMCQIVDCAAPTLCSDTFSVNICEFVNICLSKDVLQRPTYKDLLSLRLADVGANVPYQVIGNAVATILDS